MKFYLDTHEPSWLRRCDIPLFISRRRLVRLKTLPRAKTTWALDSGGFTELALHGHWQVGARDYAADVRRFAGDVGLMEWAAPQDWMCEPMILKKTGHSIAEHQALTTANFLELTALAPEIPWIPVLQGWQDSDYLRHLEEYGKQGVDLTHGRLVGLGSVCRRQGSDEIKRLVWLLRHEGVAVHGFGVKTRGLHHFSRWLASADSMAWSDHARHEKIKLDGCPGRHRQCNNCLRYALLWRERLLTWVAHESRQGLLDV